MRDYDLTLYKYLINRCMKKEGLLLRRFRTRGAGRWQTNLVNSDTIFGSVSRIDSYIQGIDLFNAASINSMSVPSRKSFQRQKTYGSQSDNNSN